MADVQNVCIDNAGSTVQGRGKSGRQKRINSTTAEAETCLIVARVHEFGRVLGAVGVNWGEARAAQVLFDECSRLFAEVRHSTNVAYEELSISDGQVRFRLRDAAQTHLFCQKVIEKFAQRNAGIPNSEAHIRLCLGAVKYVTDRTNPAASGEPKRLASRLADACPPDEILISSELFRALSIADQALYGPQESLGPQADGVELIVRRRRIDSVRLMTGEKAVMVIDMGRFSKIQKFMKITAGPEALTRLTNQIKKILADGFAKAHKNYKDSLMDFTGDGGIFIFDSVEAAHEIAANILEVAEEESATGRKEEVEEAMRCFRVGIAHGDLQQDREGKPTGLVIAVAKRLESGGCTGEVRISPEAYRQLPQDAKRLYGGPEPILAKEHDGHGGKMMGHRRKVKLPAPWEEEQYQQPASNPDFVAQVQAVRVLQDCFVISPIDDRNPRIVDVFTNLITPACEKLGFKARRADQIPGGERMTVITKYLSSAPIAVAYLGQPAPHWNADVMLEVGYRFATQRPLVMISEPPLANEDGRIPSFTKLLPFHLAHKTVIEVGAKVQSTVDRLVEEMTVARESISELDWKWVHPVMEYSFANARDVQMMQTSPQARELFDLPAVTGPQDVEEMRRKNRERFVQTQFNFFREEQWEIIRRIRDADMFQTEDAQRLVPSAHVPVILKDAPLVNGKPTGYLPVVVRHANRDGKVYLQTLYLKVSASLRQGPPRALGLRSLTRGRQGDWNILRVATLMRSSTDRPWRPL